MRNDRRDVGVVVASHADFSEVVVADAATLHVHGQRKCEGSGCPLIDGLARAVTVELARVETEEPANCGVRAPLVARHVRRLDPTRWRMELAARLLRESEQPVGRISHRVGYTSEFAFSRAFSKHRGEPPGRYRKRIKSSAAA